MTSIKLLYALMYKMNFVGPAALASFNFYISKSAAD